MHLLPTFLAFLASLSTTLALATTPSLDLLARADPPDPKLQGITWKCGVCILQCSAIAVACGFACGPGEVFGPIGCMVLFPPTPLSLQPLSRTAWPESPSFP